MVSFALKQFHVRELCICRTIQNTKVGLRSFRINTFFFFFSLCFNTILNSKSNALSSHSEKNLGFDQTNLTLVKSIERATEYFWVLECNFKISLEQLIHVDPKKSGRIRLGEIKMG